MKLLERARALAKASNFCGSEIDRRKARTEFVIIHDDHVLIAIALVEGKEALGMTLSIATHEPISAPPVHIDLAFALEHGPKPNAARSRSGAASRRTSMSPHAPFANAPTTQLSLDLYQARPRPFLKWAGGKGSLIPQLRALLPSDLTARRYVEPFVGGGALFFALEPRRALLRDINRQLVATYRCVQQTVEPLIERLTELQRTHSAEQYYDVRARYNATPPAVDTIERVAQFVYLNRTCCAPAKPARCYG